VADGFIWGRGTVDDKVHVLSLLEAAETLIGRGFTPARTILFAFGDDEENGGKYGAKQIVALLKSRGVKPEFVIDEGGLIVQGVVPGVEKPVAIIGTAEKGVLDAVLTTKGAGGHSSAPPNHTAIGELSAALTKIEENPFHATLPSVTEQQYRILAPYLPFLKRLLLANLWLFKPLVIYSALGNPEQAGGFHTTIAEDMISGGFKENALPTSARAVINFRILPGDTTAGILDRLKRTVDDDGVTIVDETPEDVRDPSPISPTDSEGYKTLSLTIGQEFPEAIVAPNLLNAATDSTFYTALTPNVYRFLALEGDGSVLAMVHGLNERIPPEKYLKTVEFTVQLMENIR
jgi:carboxypeptidase PM20D1